MAKESVIYLKVESKFYDDRLKRAADGMKAFEEQCRASGKSLADADKKTIAYVQAMGNMATVAAKPKQQLRELTDTILALSQTYQQLSAEEKQSQFGQAMSQSINQLKVRAAELQDQIGDLNLEIKGMASDTSTFDQLAGGVGTAVAAFQTLQGAMQLFGIEDENAVQAIAKLQAAMAVTNGLTQIQTALQKQSAVMLGITAIQEKAAAAATALDAAAKGKNIVVTKGATAAQAALNVVAKANPYILLASAIAAVGVALYAMSKASKQAEEAEEKRLKAEEEAEQQANATRESFVNASAEAMNSASKISSLQTAYMNANSEMEKTGILRQAQEEFKKLGIECNGLSDAQTLLINKGSQIVEMIRMQGTVAALSAIRMETYKKSFMNLLANGYDVAGAAALAGANSDVRQLDDQILKLQGKIQNSKSSLGIGTKSGSGSRRTSKTEEKPIEGSIAWQEAEVARLNKEWKNAAEEGVRDNYKKQLDAAQAVLDEMLGKTKDVQQVEQKIEFNAEGMSAVKKQLTDALSGSTFGSGEYVIAANKLLDFTTFENLLKTATENSLDISDTTFKGLFKDLEMGLEIPDAEWEKLVEQINEKLAELDLPPITLDVKTGNVEELGKEVKSVSENVNGAISVFGQLGQAMQDIDDPGAKVAGIIMEAIANVAGAFAKSLMGTFNPWEFIAASIAGVSTMISTIAAIKQVTSGGGASAGKFATGGVVGGNSYSGDRLMAYVNSGETILTPSQADKAMAGIQGNPMQNLQLSTEISGTNLRIVLNNDNRSKGGSRGYYANIH